jgi:hypothetical protein
MSDLNIRGISDDLMRTLKIEAATSGLTLKDYVLQKLKVQRKLDAVSPGKSPVPVGKISTPVVEEFEDFGAGGRQAVSPALRYRKIEAELSHQDSCTCNLCLLKKGKMK